MQAAPGASYGACVQSLHDADEPISKTSGREVWPLPLGRIILAPPTTSRRSAKHGSAPVAAGCTATDAAVSTWPSG